MSGFLLVVNSRNIQVIAHSPKRRFRRRVCHQLHAQVNAEPHTHSEQTLHTICVQWNASASLSDFVVAASQNWYCSTRTEPEWKQAHPRCAEKCITVVSHPLWLVMILTAVCSTTLSSTPLSPPKIDCTAVPLRRKLVEIFENTSEIDYLPNNFVLHKEKNYRRVMCL